MSSRLAEAPLMKPKWTKGRTLEQARTRKNPTRFIYIIKVCQNGSPHSTPTKTYLVFAFIEPRLEGCDGSSNPSAHSKSHIHHKPHRMAIKAIVNNGGNACADQPDERCVETLNAAPDFKAIGYLPSYTNIINTGSGFQDPAICTAGRKMPKRRTGETGCGSNKEKITRQRIHFENRCRWDEGWYGE